MLLGMLLRIDKRCTVNHIELNVLNSQARESAQVGGELLQSELPRKRRRRKLDVEQAPVGVEHVLELAHAFKARRRTMLIAPDHRRQAAISELLVCTTPVRSGAACRTKWNMRRHSIATGLELSAAHVVVFGNLAPIKCEETRAEQVDLIDIVAVLGIAIDERLTQLFVRLALPIPMQHFEQLSI